MNHEDRLAAIQHEYDEWAKEGTDLDGFALYVGPEDVKWLLSEVRTLRQAVGEQQAEEQAALHKAWLWR